MAQIIYDALGKKWAVAFMSLIAVGQYLMSVSIMIALSRQIWSFARDDGLPVVYNFVKYVNPKIKVPIRATMFAGFRNIIRIIGFDQWNSRIWCTFQSCCC